MRKILETLSSYTAAVLVNPELKEGGFTSTVGLLGNTYTTGPTLTKRIQESLEFEQLSGNAKALRILEILLTEAQH